MKPQYFRWFAVAIGCSAVCGVFCLETQVSVDLAAQRGNASVLIDFRAFTEDGQPVVDLKAEDLAIKVDGKERAVSSVRFVRNARRTAPRAVAPPFATNVQADVAHDLILLVDDESIAPGREKGIRDAAARLIAALGPGDRVALFGVRPGGLNVPPGAEPSRVGDALASMVGQLGDQEVTCRTSPISSCRRSSGRSRRSAPAR